ncbi:aminotransferase class I/II-fold pyridoxal phosphate-dependent enzyme [Acuticoccus sp. M5D2P5]|uniref:aminotransferase class I/II-fold pyridoxal phosphate-dependent enzyme n=1 Tax=Acuticoccus kalidii TaxID=2910977 RepID=UPI001F45A44F|nr:aminotransferase class I/II-fold pyridoxal phosphate-dependent enzyme [Acuticoccus kalidii]MCF3936405.1 aminotransferase class I/II-fold pyridoxal phosphate-dependent enzyme [Acuticoccus kalidii]
MFFAQSPFERLRALLADVAPGAKPADLAVGNPQHPQPAFVGEVIARNIAGFGPYPPIGGTANFQRAVHDFIDRRYRLDGWFRETGALVPLNGSREGLFLAAVSARDLLQKTAPTILFANPFYQTYIAGAHGIGAEPVPMATSGGILPDWDSVPAGALDRAIAYYFGSPSNPEGHAATREDWHAVFDRAERHDFLIFADECYSEIYRADRPAPTGVLEAARERPETLPRIVVFNSLSKRSNLAGMRVGYLAGATATVAAIREFRNQAGPQVPTPLQEVAAAVYDDEDHVVANRALYDEKFADAERLLAPRFGSVTPQGGFFLWLDVEEDDEAAALRLWREAGVRCVPGSYLAATPKGGVNPGKGRLRLALVADAAVTRTALARIAEMFARAPAA